MPRFCNDFRIGISAAACIFFALSLLILPLKWIFAALTAAAFHELCHAGAVLLLGGHIQSLKIGKNGAVMSVSALSRKGELLAALAGPLGSALLILLFRWFPRVAFCGMVHCVYNFLPIYPLDGGRIIHCLTGRFSSKARRKICLWLENGCLLAVGAGAVYLTFGLDLGITPVAAAAALLIRAKSANSPCKEGRLALQ